MEPKFMISEVFGTSWKYTKSQIWVLVGLFIGYFILSSIISLFGMPAQGSMVGKIIVNLISAVISSAFMLGYIKNLFQTMDGEEPQFSAYGQQSRKIFTYLIASIIMGIAVAIGIFLLIVPGIYLAIRLQFYSALKSATKLFSVLLASKRPLITELADKLRLKYPLLPTISPCPTMRLEAIRSIIPISCRRYPKSV